MLGSLLAGCSESRRDRDISGKKFQVYRGMGSIAAMERLEGRYFQEDSRKLVPEGVEGRVPFKDPGDTVFSLWGALSRGWIHGVQTKPQLHEKAQFVKITEPGSRKATSRHLYHKGSAQLFRRYVSRV
jgi:IMP dehydrogenase